ncbi:MAG: GNAT family N-acetyltransferase [Lachnospiraceae bacterium]|nr:GNAT family N-acetyltransferase [Lachnospiraceae bacterium]
MEFTIKSGCGTSIEDFYKMVELDKKVFGEDVITNIGFAEGRYKKNSECFIAAYDGEEFAGGMMAFPITDSLASRMRSLQELIDDDISPEDVLPFAKEEGHNIFILDIVVDEKYRRTMLSVMIMNQFKEILKEKQKNGFNIKTILGFAVSKGGLMIAQRMFETKIIGSIEDVVLVEMK